jgi:hypothetical protein
LRVMMVILAMLTRDLMMFTLGLHASALILQ